MRPAKRKKVDRIKTKLTHLFAKDKFNRIKPDLSNLQDVYQNNFKVWLINNCDETYTQNGESIVISNNVIANVENVITSNTVEGFKLTHKDFIDEEIEFLNSLNVKEYDLVERKKLEAYRKVLKDNLKRSQEPKLSFDKAFHEEKDYEEVMRLLQINGIAQRTENKCLWEGDQYGNKITLLTAFYDTLKDNGLIRPYKTLQDAADSLNDFFYVNYHKGYFKRHREYREYESLRNDLHFIPKRVK
ncbi:hypothetical protein [Pareuzebyella sediminis]|uniref:hypothetical protein n=1 Tax=Pareuzebyella sediminis TaxID=2607998 RepID=UPI0011ECED91|nr:hypothetical protein [Pareuzebyella sediminis]